MEFTVMIEVIATLLGISEVSLPQCSFQFSILTCTSASDIHSVTKTDLFSSLSQRSVVCHSVSLGVPDYWEVATSCRRSGGKYHQYPLLDPNVDRNALIQKQTLPDYDDILITRINRFIQKDIDMDILAQPKRRFILYYWFAVDYFGALERIRLPACTLAAVRAKYPNLKGLRYTGHIER